ncbi:carbohydrate ABC transporter permease [Alicyclobacillus shizuokensis]|uniref:carbohydrate ABC transporter permease n=1 Tax=Alicyclobacillus shizuokensis TaxID=392014 RepID=UPI00082DCD02|nr:sugar ABC transporter permease [Alicyclobacillus shizuokensis]MCL6625258.1 sugar ABC transporter permease [Alicyclobacillus shizuokensis]
MKKFYITQRHKDVGFALLLILPTVLVLLRIFVYPIYQSAVWSFFHYNLMDGSPVQFIGWQNYKDVLTSVAFWLATQRTVYFTVLTVLFELVLGFFSALLLNQHFRGRTFFRAIIIIPWALLTLVNGLLWDWIYQPGFGLFTVLLHGLHILSPQQNPVWLANSSSIMNFVSVADIWKMTPFMTLILLAGMQAIPEELYEAVAIDGAGFWNKLIHVTIPQLMPSILVAIVLRIMGAFRVYDILTVFTGDPQTSITYLTFNYAFRYFYLGKASAMAWISTIFILILIVIYIRVLKKNLDQA